MFLWACTHLYCTIPWRPRMRWVYYMISAALFKDRYSLPISCWIKHEMCAAGWVVCVPVCVWWVGGWLSGGVGRGKEDEGVFKTPLQDIPYNRRSMNAFDLTHILTGLLSSLIHVLLRLLILCYFFLCVVLIGWKLLTKSKLVQKRMQVCSFQEE